MAFLSAGKCVAEIPVVRADYALDRRPCIRHAGLALAARATQSPLRWPFVLFVTLYRPGV